VAEKITLNIDDLTIQDLQDFEDEVGKPLSEAVGDNMSARALKALVWVVKRAEDPNFTLDDAGKIKVEELDLGDDGGNPTQSAGEQSAGGLKAVENADAG